MQRLNAGSYASYSLLDCGDERRLELFDGVTVSRPAPSATFRPAMSREDWQAADLSFTRERGWEGRRPENWRVAFGPAVLQLRPAAQGQLGAFPEHVQVCDRLDDLLNDMPPTMGLRVLNLFAHTGLATLRIAAHPTVAETIHLDAAGAAVKQARENAAASGLAGRHIRWLVDDTLAFLKRELRRGHTYDVILADPPAFGRSKKGGEWKLERDLPELLKCASKLLAPECSIFCLTCHREGWTEDYLRHMTAEAMPGTERYESFPLLLHPESGGNTLTAGCACLGITM